MRLNLALAYAVFLLCGVAAAQAQNRNIINPDNLTKVSDHVWVIKGGTAIGIVVGDRATLVVETGLGTPNGKAIAEVAKYLSTKGQKLYLTTTHYHVEHATGDGGFPADAIMIRPKVQQAELEAEGQVLIDSTIQGSEEGKKLLQDFRYKKPGILFDKEYLLDLGGVQARLSWVGPAHTRGDELITVEPDSVMFTGDVVQNKAGPYFYCAECSPRGWLTALDRVAALHPKIIVPDHSPMGDASLIAQERSLILDFQSTLGTLKAQGKSADEAGQIMAKEFPEKYPGWSSMNRISNSVPHAYADTDGP